MIPAQAGETESSTATSNDRDMNFLFNSDCLTSDRPGFSLKR